MITSDPFSAVAEPLREVIAEVLENCEGWNAYNPRVEAIETEARSGFIPFTNGGWDGRISSGLHASEGGGYLPNCLRKVADDDYAEMCAAYVRDNYPSETLDGAAAVERFSRDIQNHDTNPAAYRKAEDWEQGWSESDDEFYYDARAIFYAAGNSRNETGEDEVYLFAAVNTDFGYGRDSIPWLSAYGSNPDQHSGAWERTLKLRELTPETLAECKAAMIAALADA